MNKNIWAGLVALLLVVVVGVAEVFVVNKAYAELGEQCKILLQSCEEHTLSAEQFDEFDRNWYDLREKSELLLPHVDVYELNLRVAETRSYVQSGDFKSAHAQLKVIEELIEYIPHLMIPSLRHIV